MLGQIQVPQDSALWCSTERDRETSLCPSTVWQLLCWQLPLEPSSEKVHVGITHTHPSPGPGLMMSIPHSSGLCAAVLLSTPGMPQLCWPAAPIPPQLVVDPGAAVCNLSGCFALLPLDSPPQARWLSSQLNEALNQRIIQL